MSEIQLPNMPPLSMSDLKIVADAGEQILDASIQILDEATAKYKDADMDDRNQREQAIEGLAYATGLSTAFKMFADMLLATCQAAIEAAKANDADDAGEIPPDDYPVQ